MGAELKTRSAGCRDREGVTPGITMPGAADLDDRRRGSDHLLAIFAQRFTHALLAADGVEAEAVIDEALARGLPASEVQVGVVQAAMAEVGCLWERAEASVADEHIATAISQRALVRLYEDLWIAEPRSRERVVLAAVQGQQHTMGLRMIADVLEGAGFDVAFAGGDVPVEALTEFVARFRPAVVGLSFRFALGADRLDETISAVRGVSDARILLGGDRPPDRVRSTDIAWAESSLDVLDVIERLVESRSPRRSVSGSVTVRSAATLPRLRAPGTVEERLATEAERTADTARQYVRHAQELHRLAFCDPLTRLPNRRAFDDHARTLAESRRKASLLMIDIDRFKEVNDTLGHEAGDHVLCEVASHIAACTRPSDLVARIGGDEFAVLLPGCDPKDASVVAGSMRAAVEAAGAQVTLSIGVARLDSDVRAASLAADQALYEAKAAGRNRVCSGGR